MKQQQQRRKEKRVIFGATKPFKIDFGVQNVNKSTFINYYIPKATI